MSKINNVRLPNAARADYDPQQFNQLVRSLEQVILQLNGNYTPTTTEDQAGALRWFTAAPGAAGFTANTRGGQLISGTSAPFAMLMSNVDQTSAGITSENLISFDIVPVSNGIYIENNTRIKVPAAGHYFVSFSIQVSNRGNTAAEFEVWAKDTGTNFPLSNTRFDIPARKSGSIWSHIVPAVSGVFSVSNPATDYLEIAWWSNSADVFLEHYGVGTNPARPEIPSIILAMAFVSSTAIGGSPTVNATVNLSSVRATASLGAASAGPAIFITPASIAANASAGSPSVSGNANFALSGVGTFGYAGLVSIPDEEAVTLTGVSAQVAAPQAYFMGLSQSFNILYAVSSDPDMAGVTSGSSDIAFSWPTAFFSSFTPTIGQSVRFSVLSSTDPVLSGNVLGGISLNNLLYSNPNKPEFTIKDVYYVTQGSSTFAYWVIDSGQVATSTASINTGQYAGTALSAKFFTGVGATGAVNAPSVTIT